MRITGNDVFGLLKILLWVIIDKVQGVLSKKAMVNAPSSKYFIYALATKNEQNSYQVVGAFQLDCYATQDLRNNEKYCLVKAPLAKAFLIVPNGDPKVRGTWTATGYCKLQDESIVELLLHYDMKDSGTNSFPNLNSEEIHHHRGYISFNQVIRSDIKISDALPRSKKDQLALLGELSDIDSWAGNKGVVVTFLTNKKNWEETLKYLKSNGSQSFRQLVTDVQEMDEFIKSSTRKAKDYDNSTPNPSENRGGFNIFSNNIFSRNYFNFFLVVVVALGGAGLVLSYGKLNLEIQPIQSPNTTKKS